MIRRIKIVLGCSLIIIGILYEVIIFIQLDSFSDSDVTSSTSEKHHRDYSVDDIIEMAEGRSTTIREQIPKHNYHHFLYGLGMIAGAMILASVKEKGTYETAIENAIKRTESV